MHEKRVNNEWTWPSFGNHEVMEIELLAPSLDLFLLVLAESRSKAVSSLAEHFPQVAFFFLLIPFHLSKIEPQSPSQLFISTAMCVRVPM
jgi:hypothetical protein